MLHYTNSYLFLKMIATICVTGAGTMGSGIAQVAAQSGFKTILFDLNNEVLDKAKLSIQKSLQFLVEKQKFTESEATIIFNRVRFTGEIKDCIADIIIEAIIENAVAKVSLFNQLAVINSIDAVFASNTSSISISEIQKQVIQPQRMVGMHFFNPPSIMKLVEVVKGSMTTNAIAQTVYELAIAMNKTPVICKDAPGFIVNRVARQYYLEALRLAEKGVAGFEEIDTIMESVGFKMGPFKLMDLIGMDVNLAVSKSIYEAFDKATRFEPSSIQINKVQKGELGRKTGKGFYQYTTNA
jgi:3-hydroxybutyryl-CoA dehydrogenase